MFYENYNFSIDMKYITIISTAGVPFTSGHGAATLASQPTSPAKESGVGYLLHFATDVPGIL